MSQVDDWVVIDDFTPGIHSDFHQASSANSTAMPRNGAATVTGTWRCTADRTGALVPLPRRVSAGTGTQPLTGTTADRYEGGVAQAYVLDALVMGPVTQSSAGLQTANPEALYILYGICYAADDPAIRRQYVVGKAIPRFAASTWTFMFSKCDIVNVAGSPSYPSGALDRSRFTIVTPTIKPEVYRPRVVGSFSFERGPVVLPGPMTPGDAAITDFDTLTHVNGALPAAAYFTWDHFVTPRDLFVPNTLPVRSVGTTAINVVTEPAALDTIQGSPLCVAHQGRFVRSRRAVAPFFGGGAGWFLHDYVTYTDAGDCQAGAADAIFGEENPSPIGAMVSMSANELLIIKHRGGGVFVRGDIANPQVVRAPFLHSTGGYTMTPAATPFGVFYGTRDGVVRYSGGDTSELVSKQLDGPFWVPQAASDVMEGHRARFGFWHPWVLAPNGYMLHTDTGAWWRLDDPANVPHAHSHYDVSASTGQMYAFRHKIVGLNFDTTPQYDTFSQDVLATSWRWTSQPLVESLEREVSYGELELVAQRSFAGGPATITVVLTGFTAEGVTATATNVFTLAANSAPQFLRQAVNTNFRARFVQVQITADSGSASVAAPKLFSIRLGRRASAHAPRSS